MTEETTTAPDKQVAPSKIRNRMDAIALLKRFEVPFNETTGAAELIVIAKAVAAGGMASAHIAGGPGGFAKTGKGEAKELNRTSAITILRQANQPFDEALNADEIIKLAKAVPKEKYFRIKIQEKPNVNAPAYIGVLGRPWLIVRGEEVVVPSRVVTALENAVSFVPYQKRDKVTGEMEILYKQISAELYSVLGEVPAP